MKLFAQIADPTGLTDGVQGWSRDFVTLAESDDELQALQEAGVPIVARSEAELERLVGADLWPWFVEVPRYPNGHEHAGQFLHCAGMRYEGGKFIDPDA